MPKLVVTQSHQLDQAEAVRRVQQLAQRATAAYQGQVKDLQQHMEGNQGTFSFSIMGMKISGQVQVEPDQVRVEVDLPLAAMMVKGRIENELKKHLQELLAG